MPGPVEGFAARIERLKADVSAQSRRVQGLIEAAFEALFAGDAARAKSVLGMDDEIDRVDVEIEQASVKLLGDATRDAAPLSPDLLRRVLTVVKVNNELERIADCGVSMAELAVGLSGRPMQAPETFRVMTNSVLGILRDTSAAYERRDPRLAKVVLQSEDAVEAFKSAILRDAEQCIASGSMSVDGAFLLHEIAGYCVRIADHCTNIAEQIIYSATGVIVRHTQGRWVEVGKVLANGPG